MKAVVSVIGKDRTGIISAVSTALAERGINIEDISQTIIQKNFVMIMLVDTGSAARALDGLADELQNAVKSFDVVVHVQHEDLFNVMHRV